MRQSSFSSNNLDDIAPVELSVTRVMTLLNLHLEKIVDLANCVEVEDRVDDTIEGTTYIVSLNPEGRRLKPGSLFLYARLFGDWSLCKMEIMSAEVNWRSW